MLGYPTAFMAYMSLLDRQRKPRKPGAAAWVLAAEICILLFSFRCRRAQVKKRIDPSSPAGSPKFPPAVRKPPGRFVSSPMVMWIFATAVRDLRADHVEYNEKTSEALARGHVQFDFENQHLEATKRTTT